jgi:hypothetical protein
MPKHPVLSRGLTLATAATLMYAAGTASAAVDTEADWQQRKSSAGVLYSESFEFGSKSELLDAALGYTDNPPANSVDVDSTIKLAGSKSLKLTTNGAAGANGGSWAQHYNGTDTTQFKNFYFQFGIYLPRATLAYRSKGGDGQLKLVNLEQYGAGQIVITNRKFLGFPTMLINGTATIEEQISESVVPNVGSEYVFQPAVSEGNSSSPGNACDFWAKYGPARGITINEDYGESNPEPRLDRRNLPNGWPNRCALQSGVPFAIDGWTTIEVYVEYNSGNPSQSTIKAWAAPYGTAPRMFINQVNNAGLGSNANVYKRFELLNYDTPREPEANRPPLYTYFDEIVVSTQAIKFPGGFSLPNGPTARPKPPTDVRSD